MAKPFHLLSSSFLVSFTIIAQILATHGDEEFVKAADQNPHNKMREEKMSHFKFYWHDILSGQKPTAVTVVPPPKAMAYITGFGMVRMMDNPLTLGPELSSKLVGRAEGFYASASQEVLGLLMVMNLNVIEGKYNGSTITVLGRNAVLNEVREMPVIGGSGLFRFARGYAEARTHTFDVKTGDATVEYNVYAMHY